MDSAYRGRVGETLFAESLEDRRKAEAESHLIRDSSGVDEETGQCRGVYPLCGRGDVNTYSLFAELNHNLINQHGRVGCILPTGIATDDTNKLFFKELVEDRLLVSFFAFENEEKLFPRSDQQGDVRTAVFWSSGRRGEKGKARVPNAASGAN